MENLREKELREEVKKMSREFQEALFVIESECGKMSVEGLELVLKEEKGEITYDEILTDIKKKYGVD